VKPPLPIDPLLPEIVAALARERAIVLEAPPGAGKTTRVPPALLDTRWIGDQEILVLQPRRLATRLAAGRVAEELGQRVGETVGYQVRFEDVSGPKTRIRYLTEGILGRRLLSEPTLPGVGVVVLDEFHERHLAGDIALAQLAELQKTSRPDLKLVVMSATLEADPVATYLGGCPRLRSEGRRFDVAVEYLREADPRPLEHQVLAALKRILASGTEGDVLVFLPGAGEIRRAREACADLGERHGLELHALHGDLPPAEQDRAVRPSRRRKVILSTNVAETSVTIDGVCVVVDSGLARQASHSPWSGLPSLKVAKISRASAIQRTGRAGRTRPGSCLRLYTEHDFLGRPEHDAPEIHRLDLAETILALRASGVADMKAFPFFEAPPAAALEAAEDLLRLLGAVDATGKVTPVGRAALRFPVHPRLGRLLVEAERRGVGADGALLAALIGERDIRGESRAQLGPNRLASRAVAGPSDLLAMWDRFREGERTDASPSRLRSLGLEPGAFQAVARATRQLGRAVERKAPTPLTEAQRDQALLLSVLAGYPDRIARRRRPKSPEVVLSGGGSATLSEASVVQDAELMVTVDAEERPGARSGVIVRTASQIEPEWLLELFPEGIEDFDALQWNAQNERVERVVKLSYRGLALEETRTGAAPSDRTSEVLAEAALAAGIEGFVDAEWLAAWRARRELLAQAFPEKNLPRADEASLRSALVSACAGLRSFEELRQSSLSDALSHSLDGEQQRLLAAQAPERLALPGGRQVRVHYEPGKPPWIESRLQDFFGLSKGPAVAGGRVPVVLHLLAPNQRAVQVTTDLAGFWQRHYPSVRKELMRKYPRHAWPEDPLHAQPPGPRRS
jgi:ATP-dependent helicase HrpB